jgi:putative zinc finger/helix-turn-helix YgiT family protein
MICPTCGKQTTHTVEEYNYRESGLDNVFVRGVDLFQCACGEEYVQLPGVQEIHNQIASAILNKESLLTGAEAKFLRKWLRMTSEDLARALGVTRVTVSRWENQEVPDWNDRPLRLYASNVGKIYVDFGKLFSSGVNSPNPDFKIVVGKVFRPSQTADNFGLTSRNYSVAVQSTFPKPATDYAPIHSEFNITVRDIPTPGSAAANQDLALAA